MGLNAYRASLTLTAVHLMIYQLWTGRKRCGHYLHLGEDRLGAREIVTSKRKWLALSFAFAATIINYLDRQTPSVMAPVLSEKFHISASSYSRIIFAFMLAYTLMNGVSGRVLDRLGSKIGYGLTIAWWSAAEILHAFSAGPFGLGVFRFLLGVGEAGNYPAGVKLIVEWFPVSERSLASGIFNSGASIGAILAPPLLAWIVLSTGWRTAFVVVGLTGFVWLGAWVTLYREPEPVPEASTAGLIPLGSLLGSRFLWQFTLSKVFSDPVWYFYTFWFPPISEGCARFLASADRGSSLDSVLHSRYW
jgi:MFS transporter, ACS family, hexuronate transporter